MRDRGLASAISLALLAGIAVAWTPRYWSEAVAVVSIAMVASVWALTTSHIGSSRVITLVWLIAAWGPLQLGFGQSAVPWLTRLSSLTWAVCAVCFVVSSGVLRSERSRKTFLDILLWASTALAVAAMLQMYVTPERVLGVFAGEKSVVGTFHYKNQFAAMIELTAPIALWKVYSGEVARGGLCYAAMFAAVATSASRAGVALVLAEFAVFLALMVYGRRLRVRSAAATAAVVLLLAGAALAVAGTERIWSRFEEPHPYVLRGMLLNSTLRMIPVHPWFGFGLGTWHAVYPGFATFDSAVYINEAHNDWAQWSAEGGLPFAAIMAILVIRVARPALGSIWGLGVISVMVQSFVDYPLGEPVLKFLWFTMAGALTQMKAGGDQCNDSSIKET